MEADVWVGLTITGDFDPNDITLQLGLKPTHARLKGEFLSSRRRKFSATSVWAIDSESSIDADRIEPHLEWLLGILEPRADALSGVVAKGAFAYADCFWASPGLSGGPWIEPVSMRRLSDLDLPLIISFYVSEVD